jgi:hypothetical protein
VIADADRPAEGMLQTMSLRGAFDARMNRGKSCGTDATSDAIARLIHRDPAKALAMTYFSRLVADGYAEWHMLDNGDIRLHLLTGEIYLLAKTMITRIA